MQVLLNNKVVYTDQNDLQAFLNEQKVQTVRGIAVAVNAEVIPRTLWAEQFLQEGDSILIITATQGG